MRNIGIVFVIAMLLLASVASAGSLFTSLASHYPADMVTDANAAFDAIEDSLDGTTPIGLSATTLAASGATTLSGSVTVIGGGVTTRWDNASSKIDAAAIEDGALPTAITVASANIVNDSIVNADINTAAAIVASKLDLTSPGAIGSTAAGSGAFTTLSASSPITSTSGGGVLDAGSYASKLTATGVEMATIATTKASGWTIGYGSYGTVTGEDGYPIGFASLVESTHTTGTKTLQGAQFMAFLGTPGGSQAAHLKTRGGDGTAGMYAVWAKTGANANCVIDSGARTAPLWVDNQVSGTLSGEEYGIFASTGASRPTAFLGFETTSSGYSQLLYFDETFNSGAGTCVTTDAVPGGNQDARIMVYYNGTQYYIPLYR